MLHGVSDGTCSGSHSSSVCASSSAAVAQAVNIHIIIGMAKLLKDQLSKADLIFVHGGTVSGKKTQSENIAKNGWTHICNFELVRTEISKVLASESLYMSRSTRVTAIIYLVTEK